MKKRWLSILLVCGMLLTTLPSAVFAEGEDGAECVCTTACTAEVRNADCPTCGAEDAALEDCAKYEAKQENELNNTQEPAEPQKEDQEGDQEAQPEEIKPTEPTEEPAVQEEPTVQEKPQVAAKVAANNKAVAVQAEHKHCACGGSINAGGHTNHSDVAYTAWNGANNNDITYTNNTAHVYLTGNATLGGHLTVDGKTLYLCLNGKTLSSNGSGKIQVKNGGNLVLCDCQGGGTFKGATKNVWGGACVYLYASTFDMFGGKLTGGKVTEGGGGGAIAMDDQQCVFNMYGGEISGNNGQNYGGAIFRKFNANMPNTTGGAFNMYGGTIKNNTAKNGGAFFSTTGGNIKMTGGTISGNKATMSSNNAGGGAIYMRGSGKINISGSAQITGNSSSLDGGAILMGWGTINISDSVKINNNTANRWGGAICLRQDSNQVTTLNMRGGEISGNKATKEGGAVHAVDADCTFNLSGGKITGNTSGDGGAIYLNQETSWLIMQGGEISGNTATGNGGGVYIYRSGSVCQLYSGKIENNKASGNGGGIYINPSNSGQLRVGNKPLVQNNTVSGKANNVYLPSGKTLTIEIGMSTGASVGVTTENTSYPVAFSNAYKKDYAKCFFADDVNAHVEYKDDQKLYLVSGMVPRTLTVTFDPNGGTLDEADKTKSLTTGETYGTLPVPSYEGYNFAGWYTEKTGGTKIEENTTVTMFGTQTLYAHWTPIHVHAYTQQVQKPEAMKTPADCTNNAVYYLSCACGEVSTNDADTFTAANTALDHDWGKWTQNSDQKTHTRICKRDASHTETENCHGGTATCTNKAVCKDCGGAYGEMAAHDFTAKVAEEDYLKSPATCTTKAVYYKSCAACGKTSKGTDAEATFESGNVLGHDWGEAEYTWSMVGDVMCSATKACKKCPESISAGSNVATYAVVTPATCLTDGLGRYTATFTVDDFPTQTKEVTLLATGHDWGETEYTWTPTETGYTCTAKRVCKKDETHVETETVPAAYAVVTKPTCLTAGLGRYQASFAADWAEDASKDVPLSALDHDWGAWKSNGDGTHTRICARDSSHTETDNCGGGTATCTELATCTTCGETYGELAAHDFTAEVAEEDYLKSEATCTEAAVYYKSCTACGLTSEGTEQEDTFQSGDPLGHDYDTKWSQDETHHWHVCQRCQDIADLEAHTASGWITDTAATAKSDGEKHKECTVCGYILETDTIPATGSKTKPGKQDNTKTRIKTNAPKTGDDSSLLLWTALLGVSGVGVTGVVRYGRKRKDNE